MHFTAATISVLSLATITRAAVVQPLLARDGVDQVSPYCGCEDQSDANVDDCLAAIEMIDVEAKTMGKSQTLRSRLCLSPPPPPPYSPSHLVQGEEVRSQFGYLTIDVMKAIDTVKVGLWATISVMYQSGNCALGIATIQQPPAPKGGSGSIFGTRLNGQDMKDVTTVCPLQPWPSH